MPENQPFKLRSLILSVYVPTALFSIGEGAIVPILPAAAERLGASLPVAGLIAGLLMAGVLLGDLPAGIIVARIGERKAMIYAATFSALGISTSVVAPNLSFLGVGVLLVGLGHAVFGLARQVYIAEHIPYSHRARALSIIGGTFRIGSFFGPLLAALLISIFGIPSVFVSSMALWGLAAIVLLFTKEEQKLHTVTSFKRTAQIAVREKNKLLTVGVVAMIVAVMRNSRTIGLPLLAIAIHLAPEKMALYIGIAGAVELSLFFLSGQVMDKYGRRWAAIPTLVGMALTNLLFFIVTDAPMFLTVAIILSIANALSAGLVLVLGADSAPADARSEYLSSFRLLVDTGSTVTSPLLSLLIVLTGALAPAMSAISAIGLFGAWLAVRHLPAHSKPAE
ncbi:MAG: MFS transporter [Micrococcales bacterium]